VVARREDLGRIPDRDPADRDERAVVERRVDVHHAVDADLDLAAEPRPWEERAARREEAAVADGRPVEVGMRPD
jgi:hypothetical protein